jgi:hypothetical protein
MTLPKYNSNLSIPNVTRQLMEDVVEDLIRLVNQESASQAQNIYESSYQSIAKVGTYLELSLHRVHCQVSPNPAVDSRSVFGVVVIINLGQQSGPYRYLSHLIFCLLICLSLVFDTLYFHRTTIAATIGCLLSPAGTGVSFPLGANS